MTEDKGCRDQCARRGFGVELLTIAGEFAHLPSVEFPSGWQETVAKQLGLQPVLLLRCFIDIWLQ